MRVQIRKKTVSAFVIGPNLNTDGGGPDGLLTRAKEEQALARRLAKPFFVYARFPAFQIAALRSADRMGTSVIEKYNSIRFRCANLPFSFRQNDGRKNWGTEMPQLVPNFNKYNVTLLLANWIPVHIRILRLCQPYSSSLLEISVSPDSFLHFVVKRDFVFSVVYFPSKFQSFCC